MDSLDEMRVDLIRNGSFMEEEDLKLHILNNLLPEYETLVERSIAEYNTMDLEELKCQIRAKYVRISKYTNKKETNDQVMISHERSNNNNYNNNNNTYRKFKGKCFNCGKIGHRSSNCRSREGSTTPTPRIKSNVVKECNYCDKNGHSE